MNVKRSLIGSVVVCGALALLLRALARPAAAETAANTPSYDAIDAYVAAERERLNIPGVSLAIVDGDEIVHLRGFGRAAPNGEAPSPQTPFFIGSLTKSFTALAVMQLAEAGKIDLDAPVQRYLPWFRLADAEASAQITVRDLLNQTGGLSEAAGRIPLADFDDSPGATERQARALATLPIDRPAGSAFEYSNANYNLLGLIVEAAGGESYADYVQSHIFAPLHMDHSYTAPAAEDGLAVGHRYWFAAPIAAPDLPVPAGSLPSGQLIASAADMGHYMIAQLNDGRYQNTQLLSPAGVAEMHRGAAEYVEMGVSFGKYGMGWFDDEIDGTRLLWHSGIVPHSFAYMALLPEQKKGVVLLCNAYNYLMTPALTEFGAGAAALLAGKQAPPRQFGYMPWVQRGLLLIPLLQLIGGGAMLRRLRERRPGGLLPLLLTLLPALTLIPLLGPMRGFWLLYMPDYSWIAIISGGVAGIWAVLGAGLTRRARRNSPTSLERERA